MYKNFFSRLKFNNRAVQMMLQKTYMAYEQKIMHVSQMYVSWQNRFPTGFMV